MSIWRFTTPAGEAYELQGPPGSTYDQAKAVFDKQYGTGGLTGIPVGGLVNAVTQSIDGLATAPAKIGPQAVTVAQQAGNYLVLPTPVGTVPANAITTSDFVNTKTNAQTIGTVSSEQIQGLVATVAVTVNQSSNVITSSKGLGTYGLTADQLQNAGLIKPGVADQVRQDPANAVSILKSPTSWTGQQGATDIDAILNDAGLQTVTQQSLMANSFNQLKQNGTINGTESSETVGPLVNAATVYGVANTKQWLSNNAPAVAVAGITGLIASSSFGGTFGTVNKSISGGGGALSSGTVVAGGYVNTTNRLNVNQAMTAIIGNPKIPTPNFPSAGSRTSNSVAATAAIQSAVTTLTTSGLSGAQIVAAINATSDSPTISTNGGILRNNDGSPALSRSGTPIAVGDSATLGSGITSADKAAMFSGAASAVTGTKNDGIPGSITSIGTSISAAADKFVSSFNNTATQKALVGSILSGNPAPLASLAATTATTAAVNAATQSATPAVNSAVSGAINSLKEAAAADPKGFSTALKALSFVGPAFGPLGTIAVNAINSTLTPTINAALAAQAEAAATSAAIATQGIADIRAVENAIVAGEAAAADAALAVAAADANESKAEADNGTGEAAPSSDTGADTTGTQVAGGDSDPGGFGGGESNGGGTTA